MKMFVLFLLFLSNTLLAGWRDYLGWTEPKTLIDNSKIPIILPKTQEFHCPYHCGEWGFKSIQEVEWEFISLMFQADIINSFLHQNGEPYIREYDDDLHKDGPPKFDFPYEKPQNTDSRWYKEMVRSAAQGSKGRLTISDQTEGTDSDDGYECYGSLTHFWSIETIYNNERSHLGHVFTREDLHSVYFDEEDDCCAWYDGDQKVCYQFDNYIDFKQACLDLHQEVNWVREEVYLVNHSKRLKRTSDAQYQEFKTLLNALENHYISIFSSCADKHEAPSAFYNIALHYFEIGDPMRALEKLDKVFERIELAVLEKYQASKVCFTQGAVENQIALYDAAIQNLGHAIQKNSNNKEAYFERALAYFEKGEFDLSAIDFLQSNHVTKPLNTGDFSSLGFATGLIRGTTSSFLECLENSFPSMLSSLSGISHGLWAFATNPKEVSQELISASQRVIAFIQSHEMLDLLQVTVPEIQELRSQGLSSERKGELFGQILGRFETDFLLFAGISKGMKLYKDLRHANAALTLEKITQDLAKKEALTKISNDWWKKTSLVIEDIKMRGGRIGDELYKAFRGENLSELQVRKILHQAGFKTFPRPKGIPQNWTVKISKNGGGMRYRLETLDKSGDMCVKVEVRVMPGNPHSPNLMQQKPYVKHSFDGKFLDKYGNVFSKEAFETHIPLNEYNFEKISKLITYE